MGANLGATSRHEGAMLVMGPSHGVDFTEKGPDYMTWVSRLVSKQKGKKISLNSPAGAIFIIGDLNCTIYKNKPDELDGWGKFYLPKEVNMKVLGVVMGISCPCDQLVLMTCENKGIYAYDGEKLHMVAPSLQKLQINGLEYPAFESYYLGEAFKDMTDEEWQDVRSGTVGCDLDKVHNKLVKKEKSKFLENLKKTGLESEIMGQPG